MPRVLIAAISAATLLMFLGPKFIAWLRANEVGQFVRPPGLIPDSHAEKQGTPTMGGLLILVATALPFVILSSRSTEAMLVLFTTLACGAIGFLDDFMKVFKKRSLGLSGRWRMLGLLAIAGDGETGAVVMDDGLQNPALAKDLTIAVVDARRGLGNGLIIPSGPLRARLAFQLGLVDCVVVMGALDSGEDLPLLQTLRAEFPGPVLRAAVRPTEALADVAGRTVLAFAGIANPERFFRLVEGLGAGRVLRRPFPDHHAFSETDARALLSEADALGALLVTTEKDAARLAGATGACGALAKRLQTVPIAVVFDGRDGLRLDALIDGALKSVRR